MQTASIITVEEKNAILAKLEEKKQYLVRDVARIMGVCLLRVSDAINLKYSDITRGVLCIKEQKTGKEKKVALPESILEMIAARKAARTGNVHIFAGEGNRCKKDTPVSRVYVSRCLSEAAKECGIEGVVSSHSLRKYGATQIMKNTGDLAQTAALLNHSSFESTMRYLDLSVESASAAIATIDM